MRYQNSLSIEWKTEGKAMELLNKGEVSAVVLLPDEFIYDMKN